MKISIILPCYNEIANLEFGVLNHVSDYLRDQLFEWEVIIVDDESTDASFNFCQSFAEKHPSFSSLKIPHGGKPFAVYAGIQHAVGDLILFADMDQSTPMRELSKLLSLLDEDVDIVIGSRGPRREGFSRSRKLTSALFQISRKTMILPEIQDTQCGFKLFRKDLALHLFSKLSVLQNQKEASGWTVSAFDVELLFLAVKEGHRIMEVEVDWKDEDRSVTKDRFKGGQFVFESMGMAKQILGVRLNSMLGKYD